MVEIKRLRMAMVDSPVAVAARRATGSVPAGTVCDWALLGDEFRAALEPAMDWCADVYVSLAVTGQLPDKAAPVIFLHCGGGLGKSFAVSSFQKQAACDYNARVLTTAYTGVASS